MKYFMKYLSFIIFYCAFGCSSPKVSTKTVTYQNFDKTKSAKYTNIEIVKDTSVLIILKRNQ